MHIDAGQLGKYELRERLGQGGMAEVWKAFDVRLQRFVAIKFLHSTLQSDPTFVTRFLREAQAVASLHHPNIVQIYDFESPATADEDAMAYMVMDYIEGGTLMDFLHETAHQGLFLEKKDLLSLFYSISDAIDYAHRRNLLHRDIKPANILLDKRNTARNPMGEPVLTDFGIVKIMGTTAGTLTNSSMGTPLYISPEQARGRPDSTASDIYSLGVVLYEACTGRLPFQGMTPFALLQQHIGEPPPPPERFNPAIGPELSGVILRCLNKDPAQRYPNAMAMMTSLAIALGLTLPERRELPISSPDIRMLPGSNAGLDDLPTEVPGRLSPISRPPIPTRSTPLSQPPAPAHIVPQTPSRASWPGLSEVTVEDQPTMISDEARPLTPIRSEPGVTQTPPAPPLRRQRPRRPWLVVLVVLVLLALSSSGLAAYLQSRTLTMGGTTPASAVVGQVFFLSSGNGNGMKNQGLNDTVQINLKQIVAPATGQHYYAWLLPDAVQVEASDRPLGTLNANGGAASLTYVDPHHDNLVAQYSRFLVTEEPISPAPFSHSLEQKQWRFYAEFPQKPVIADCAGVQVTQLSVLCHMRHLLSGDPDLAKVHLAGGLDFWFLNNTQQLDRYALQVRDHADPTDVRHKLVNLLSILSGPTCLNQSLQGAAPGESNIPDDPNLHTYATIPLLDCSLNQSIPGYVRHIVNHLNAMLGSPGISTSQRDLAKKIGPELNIINGWLTDLLKDAQKLLAMNNAQLRSGNARNQRSALSALADRIFGGGTDPASGNQVPGVQTLAAQIQSLAKIDVIPYKM